MIGCPVRNRAWILPRYLKALEAMDYPLEAREYCFIVNNSLDSTEDILRQFAMYARAPVKIVLVDFDHPGGDKRGEYSFRRLAYLRNLLLNQFMLSACSYLFSVDSDIIVPPHALSALISHACDIVSALVPNGELRGGKTVFNILRKEENGGYVHITDFPRDKIQAVDVTGAAYLIHKRVIEKGVRYSDLYGAEDIGFCEEARRLGFTIFCDPRVECEHVMR
ncbi:glycosyltransferase [Thermosyntropha lipolytica]|nr:hypothetical protein [Thermosyntropha lipolytica]